MAVLSTQGLKNDTAARILDAAFACISDVGLSRTSVEDVAGAARVSRQTVYRYFPSKDALILALVVREEEKFLDGVRAAFASEADLEQACRDGILFCLRFARDHPLLDRLLTTDPGTLLPYLTTRAEPVIARARDAMAGLIGTRAWVRAGLLDQAAETVVRVVISYALTPPSRPDEDVARDLARIITLALLTREAKRP
jgi:AcrR family transcriptional regulator